MSLQLHKFEADWCVNCKALERTLNTIQGIEIVHHDIEKDPEEATALGIMSLPTVIVKSSEGEDLTRFTGSRSRDEILRILEPFVAL